MLVLSRKKNESIVINDDIIIVVVEIRGDKVRLGIEAPKEVPVHRREIYDAICRNEAANTPPPLPLPPLPSESPEVMPRLDSADTESQGERGYLELLPPDESQAQ